MGEQAHPGSTDFGAVGAGVGSEGGGFGWRVFGSLLSWPSCCPCTSSFVLLSHAVPSKAASTRIVLGGEN